MTDDQQHRSPFAGWRRGTGLALWTGLAVIAAALAWRRLAGAFTVELGGLAACTFATLAALVGIVAWTLRRQSAAPTSSPVRRAGPVAATLLPVLAIGAALCPSGSSGTVAYLTVLLLLTAMALWVLAQYGVGDAAASRSHTTDVPIASAAAPANEEVARHEQDAPCTPPAAEPHGTHTSNGSEQHRGSLSQWVRREALPEGGEQIEGGVRVAFAAGQKHATIHLAFSPPLARVPAIECEPLDTADVQLKVAAAYVYGARIEARREGPVDEPLGAEIGYTARTRASLETA